MYTNEITEIQRSIFEQTGTKTDAHYKEGEGVLFVPYMAKLVPQNVMLAVPEIQLEMMRF